MDMQLFGTKLGTRPKYELQRVLKFEIFESLFWGKNKFVSSSLIQREIKISAEMAVFKLTKCFEQLDIS